MNARFWVRCNGSWVKLTLQPGDIISHTECASHEEGWSASHNTWAFDVNGTVVTNDWCCEGRDCDGFTKTTGMIFCEIKSLQKVKPHNPYSRLYCDRAHNEYKKEIGGILLPLWEDAELTTTYDEFAEAAGY